MVLPDVGDLVLVLDIHRAIYDAVSKVYPKEFHVACDVHLERNVRKRYSGIGLSNLVGKVAQAFNVGDFNDIYKEIGRRSKQYHEYLEEIPKEHWT